MYKIIYDHDGRVLYINPMINIVTKLYIMTDLIPEKTNETDLLYVNLETKELHWKTVPTKPSNTKWPLILKVNAETKELEWNIDLSKIDTAALLNDNIILEAQIKALSDRSDFTDDVLQELIITSY